MSGEAMPRSEAVRVTKWVNRGMLVGLLGIGDVVVEAVG